MTLSRCSGPVLAIDIGGTKMAGGLVDPKEGPWSAQVRDRT